MRTIENRRNHGGARENVTYACRRIGQLCVSKHASGLMHARNRQVVYTFSFSSSSSLLPSLLFIYILYIRSRQAHFNYNCAQYMICKFSKLQKVQREIKRLGETVSIADKMKYLNTVEMIDHRVFFRSSLFRSSSEFS